MWSKSLNEQQEKQESRKQTARRRASGSLCAAQCLPLTPMPVLLFVHACGGGGVRSLELSLTALLTLGPIFSNHFNSAEQHRLCRLQRAAAEIVADTCLRQFLNTPTHRSSRDTERQEVEEMQEWTDDGRWTRAAKNPLEIWREWQKGCWESEDCVCLAFCWIIEIMRLPHRLMLSND